jgi:hypothetical protein
VQVLGVSPSPYYEWVGEQEAAHARRDAELRTRIRALVQFKGRYGAPRIHGELAKGHAREPCARNRISFDVRDLARPQILWLALHGRPTVARHHKLELLAADPPAQRHRPSLRWEPSTMPGRTTPQNSVPPNDARRDYGLSLAQVEISPAARSLNREKYCFAEFFTHFPVARSV